MAANTLFSKREEWDTPPDSRDQINVHVSSPTPQINHCRFFFSTHSSLIGCLCQQLHADRSPVQWVDKAVLYLRSSGANKDLTERREPKYFCAETAPVLAGPHTLPRIDKPWFIYTKTSTLSFRRFHCSWPQRTAYRWINGDCMYTSRALWLNLGTQPRWTRTQFVQYLSGVKF